MFVSSYWYTLYLSSVNLKSKTKTSVRCSDKPGIQLSFKGECVKSCIFEVKSEKKTKYMMLVPKKKGYILISKNIVFEHKRESARFSQSTKVLVLEGDSAVAERRTFIALPSPVSSLQDNVLRKGCRHPENILVTRGRSECWTLVDYRGKICRG